MYRRYYTMNSAQQVHSLSPQRLLEQAGGAAGQGWPAESR
jgi:hypothetical protein